MSAPLRIAAACLVLALAATVPASAQTVYLSTFEGGAGAEWSSQATTLAPAGARRFLGPFASDTVTLSLKDLPAHTGLRLSFDLFLIRSWNGSAPGAGPDVWDARVLGGPTLLHTTFATYADGVQSYPGSYPGPSGPGLFGADEINTLGYTFDNLPRDTVYRLVFDIYHTDPTLAVRFSMDTAKTLATAGWGLDNVRLELSRPPKPPPPGANVVVNGDFESPYLTGPRELITYAAPTTDIPGWKVSAGTVDVNALYWQNASGRQSLDLSGRNEAGTITQNVPAVPGKTYVLDFAMAGNPGGPATKEMEVRWNGAPVDQVTFENTAATTEQDMAWTRKRLLVTVPSAAEGPVELAFHSLTPGSFGPALDDVRLLPAVPGEAGMNSEFELPEVPATGAAYGLYETFEDWTVMRGDVRQARDGWEPAGGRQFLLLNETEAGGVAQSIHTVPGQTYLVRFAMAGDPRGGPAEKQLRVTWDGREVGGVQTFDTTDKTQTSMGWRRCALMVRAAGDVTELGFQSLTPGAHGPALDAASAAPVVPGDTDGDGAVGLPDAILVLRQVTGANPPNPAVQALADLVPGVGTEGRLHGDGALTLADVAATMRLAGGLAGWPASPRRSAATHEHTARGARPAPAPLDSAAHGVPCGVPPYPPAALAPNDAASGSHRSLVLIPCCLNSPSAAPSAARVRRTATNATAASQANADFGVGVGADRRSDHAPRNTRMACTETPPRPAERAYDRGTAHRPFRRRPGRRRNVQRGRHH